MIPPVGSSETFAIDTSVPGQVNVIVTGISQNLTWAGGSGAWDTSSANWTGGATVYSSGDNVFFDDTASTPFVDVTISVSPSIMTVSNNVQNYQFYDLGISTASTLTKAGSGTLTLSGATSNCSAQICASAVQMPCPIGMAPV